MVDVGSLNKEEYPLLEKRLNRLAPCQRAGDIIISARAPAYFGEDRNFGQHGRPNADDSHVPLLFVHPALAGKTIHRAVEIVDVAPTLARFSGHEKRFFRTVEYRESRIRKLEQLFETLEAHTTSHVFRMGLSKVLSKIKRRYPADQLEKDWHSIRTDLMNNLERKLKAYGEKKLLDRETLSEFSRRLAELKKQLLPPI